MLESPDVKTFVFYKREQYTYEAFQIAISTLFILAFLNLLHNANRKPNP